MKTGELSVTLSISLNSLRVCASVMDFLTVLWLKICSVGMMHVFGQCITGLVLSCVCSCAIYCVRCQ